ncbi:hypothetical protein [Clostridium sp. CF012]|nr:hypothetical protein [Clostridium sp. CF012]MBU3142658.1 hypothetical protein [Clostridium sp. CF012]
MTDFEWDEDINRGVILYARIKDGVLVEGALSKLEDVEYIETVEERIRYL